MTIARLTATMVAFLLASALRAAPLWAGILPSETDPRIRAFNTPHWICVNSEVLLDQTAKPGDRHEMLLFLPGTNGHGRGARAFLETAANLGYRCVELMYPDDVAAAQVCSNDPALGAFESFRTALLEGGKSPHLNVERADSIENRLEKLLLILGQRRPREGWGQYLHGTQIAWERIAVAGQSQGGGHAALIAVKHRVARVIMFGASKDYSRARDRPAAWYSEDKATPISCFFAINHEQDRQGCTFAQQNENLHALGLDQLGGPQDADHERPPYHHSHILVTNYPGRPVDSKTAHGTALSDKNQTVFRNTWIYLLTEATGAEASHR